MSRRRIHQNGVPTTFFTEKEEKDRLQEEADRFCNGNLSELCRYKCLPPIKKPWWRRFGK